MKISFTLIGVFVLLVAAKLIWPEIPLLVVYAPLFTLILLLIVVAVLVILDTRYVRRLEDERKIGTEENVGTKFESTTNSEKSKSSPRG